MYRYMLNQVRRLHEDVDGNMTLVNTVIVAWLVLMFAFLFNAHRITEARTRTQVAADVASASVGDIAADQMKEMVALNHTIGELLSKVLIHEAWGGPGLDEGETADTSEHDDALEQAHELYDAAAQAAGRSMQDIAFDTVIEEVIASTESTEYDTKTRLKELLTWVYRVKATGYFLVATNYAPLVAVGEALHTAAHLVELKIYQEYQTANAMHEAMVLLVPLKQRIRDNVLPELKRQTEVMVAEFPELAKKFADEAAKSVDEDLSVGVIGWEGVPQLPVEIDPLAKASSLPHLEQLPEDSSLPRLSGMDTDITRDQIVKVTQLARTTFPWVVYDREPLLKAMKLLMTLAQTEKHYKHYTEKYSKDVISQLQLEENMGLYVLKQHTFNKGYQLWTEDAALADQLFSFAVVVHQEAPMVIGQPIVFQQHNPDGIYSVSQVTLYNGNPQQRNKSHIDLTVKRIRPNLQPIVGYNTLGWTEKQNELIAKTDSGGAPVPRQPKYDTTWQSKLEPVSNTIYEAVRKNRTQLSKEAQPVAEKYFGERPSELLLQ